MRLARVVLVIGLGLAAAPVQSQDVNFGEIMRGRALSPEEERERTERRDRLEDYDRLNEEEQDRGADYSYRERYDPTEDCFWSEEAARIDYER